MDDDVNFEEDNPTGHLRDISNVFQPKYNLYLGAEDEVEISFKINLKNLAQNHANYNVNNNHKFIENFGFKVTFNNTVKSDISINNCDISFNFDDYLLYQKPNLIEDCYLYVYIYKKIKDVFQTKDVSGELILNPDYDINQSILMSKRTSVDELLDISSTFY